MKNNKGTNESSNVESNYGITNNDLLGCKNVNETTQGNIGKIKT